MVLIFYEHNNYKVLILFVALVSINKCAMKRKKIELRSITHLNVEELKRLNELIYPVRYPRSYYVEALNAGDMARLAYYDDCLAGAVCCREMCWFGTGRRRLYIITLGCLKEYRRLGVGTAMLEYVLNLANQKKLGYFESVFLHVQTNNSVAVKFYEKHGFKIVDWIGNYYSKELCRTSAYILEKKLPRF